MYFRFAVVEGADGISAYLDMLDAWYAEHRLFFVDVDVDVDDDIDVDVDIDADVDVGRLARGAKVVLDRC